MPETTWNRGRTPAQTDMWELIPDLKKLVESLNIPIPVSSKPERDALTGPAGAPVPDGTMVIRLDLAGAVETRVAGAWVSRTAFRHLRLASVQNVATATYTTISLIASGSGDDSASGINVSGGIATITRAGIYDLEGQVTFPGNATGIRYAAFLVGGDRFRGMSSAVGAASMSASINTRLYVPAGTTIAFQAYQTSGTTLALPEGLDTTRWSILYVGP